MINFSRIRNYRLAAEPYTWGAIDTLYSPGDAQALAASYPNDFYKLVSGYDGEKGYEYEARSLVRMNASEVSFPGRLSEAWRALGRDLISAEYRDAMSTLTGMDLSRCLMEANIFHFGPGCSLGPHKDLPSKLVTHVFYFNATWNAADGGCLSILRSSDPADREAEILPVVGNSCVLVRSESSWHAVSRVVNLAASSRRSMTVTFYPQGAASSMWPAHDTAMLRDYRHTPRA